MLKFYSKPVLTNEENSAYTKNIIFTLKINDSFINNETNEVVLKLSCSTNSKILNQKIKDKECKCAIQMTSSLFSSYTEFTNFDEEIELCYPCNKLQKIDQIKCIAYILSSKEQSYLWNDELIDDYDKKFEYIFLNNEIMGISNYDKIDYKAFGDPFIFFQASDLQNGRGISFSVDTPNKIKVNIGTELNETLSKLRRYGQKYEVKDIIDAFTVFNSIVYALSKIILDPNKTHFKEKEWYKVLNYNFEDEKYEDLDEFIDSMSVNDSTIDLDEIYRVAQTILHNSLEIKIIEAERK